MDTVERAVWDIFGDCGAHILPYYYDAMEQPWLEEHKKKTESMRWELLYRTSRISKLLNEYEIVDEDVEREPDEGWLDTRFEWHEEVGTWAVLKGWILYALREFLPGNHEGRIMRVRSMDKKTLGWLNEHYSQHRYVMSQLYWRFNPVIVGPVPAPADDSDDEPEADEEDQVVITGPDALRASSVVYSA